MIPGNKSVSVQSLNNVSKIAKYGTRGISAASWIYEGYNSYTIDGGEFGSNSIRTGAVITGKIIGSSAGSRIGSVLGTQLGGMIGGSFSYGFGTIPGATLGEIGGSVVGAYLGELFGGWLGGYYYDHFVY